MTEVERKLQRALNVGEIRELLEEFPDEAIPLLTCNYGDHHRTQQALPITNIRHIEQWETITPTAYSRSGLSLEEGEDEDEDTEVIIEERKDFVILS